MMTTNNSVTHHHLERMRAIVAQVIAEAAVTGGESAAINSVSLIVYGSVDDSMIHRLFEQATADTPAAGADVRIQRAESRYICWNCCGLRFESGDGVCPNCGEDALEVPEEIAFALR